MNKKNLKIVFKILAVAGVLFLIIWLNRLAIQNETVTDWATTFGYGGIFLGSVLSGFNLIIPIPIIGFYPFFVSAGFSPIMLIPIISAGMLIGDLIGYLIGHIGRDIALTQKKEQKVLQALRTLEKKYPWGPLMLLFIYASVVPLPNELIVIPMAFMGYKLRYMIIALFFGNILFNSLVAFGFLSVV